jgi:hypothetical protein
MTIIEFKGFEKIGMDSCAIIMLANCPSNLEDFKEKFYLLNQALYHTATTHHEVVGVLVNSYYFDKEDAKATWNKLIEGLNLNLIYWDKSNKENIKIKVRQANEEVIKESGNKSLNIGEPDIKIISCFLYEGINKVYTLDRGFEKTCIKLGMTVLRLPREYITKSEEVRLMNKKFHG